MAFSKKNVCSYKSLCYFLVAGVISFLLTVMALGESLAAEVCYCKDKAGPLILDQNYNPKSAYQKLVETLGGNYQGSLAGLANLASGRIYIGSAARASNVESGSSDQTYIDVLTSEFNMLTPENAMKFGEVYDGGYNWSDADNIVNFASNHNMRVRGHALVWHNQLPSQVSVNGSMKNFSSLSKTEMETVFKDHIETMISRYKNVYLPEGGSQLKTVFAWDVVNEAIGDDGLIRNGNDEYTDDDILWGKFSSQDQARNFIAECFSWAHEADSEAKLFYNDYIYYPSGQYVNNRKQGIKNLVAWLKNTANAPIDGIGIQLHIRASDSGVVGLITELADYLAGLNLELQITELDIRIQDCDMSESEQAKLFGDILNACLSKSNCTAFSMWGFTDKYTWISKCESNNSEEIEYTTSDFCSGWDLSGKGDGIECVGNDTLLVSSDAHNSFYLPTTLVGTVEFSCKVLPPGDYNEAAA